MPLTTPRYHFKWAMRTQNASKGDQSATLLSSPQDHLRPLTRVVRVLFLKRPLCISTKRSVVRQSEQLQRTKAFEHEERAASSLVTCRTVVRPLRPARVPNVRRKSTLACRSYVGFARTPPHVQARASCHWLSKKVVSKPERRRYRRCLRWIQSVPKE